MREPMRAFHHTTPAKTATMLASLLLALTGCGKEKKESLPSQGESVLRVTSTIQHPDIRRPWLKKNPFTREGLGTIIEGGRLLVTADMVSHATYIGLEKPNDGPKGTAVVEAIDEECNLAVIRPVDPEILKGSRPLPLDMSVRTGSTLQILQLEPNGSPALSPATVTTIALMPYPADNAYYLLYRVSTTIPQREGSYVVPALHDGKLAGLVMRYDSRTQAAEIIPSPLIARFLKESAKPGFNGLGRAGLNWGEARGRSLREWLGAPKDLGGVFITSIERGGAAEKAGLRKGDLIVNAEGKPIDSEGNYTDPNLGKISLGNLATLESAPGETGEIVYFRSTGQGTGTLGTATITLTGRNPDGEVCPTRISGERVPHVFMGGLLFQELSRPYLREWGGNWRSEAPQNLVYLDAFQEELPPAQKHLVILSRILPSEETLGCENLTNRLVVAINGRPIRELSDVTEAAKHPVNGFHRIDLEGAAGPIYLNASTLRAEEERLKREYGIPVTE